MLATNLSLTAGILNSLLFVWYLRIYSQLKVVFLESGAELPISPILVMTLILLFAIGSFAYWLYLRSKIKDGQPTRVQMGVSIFLLLPVVLMIGYTVIGGYLGNYWVQQIIQGNF